MTRFGYFLIFFLFILWSACTERITNGKDNGTEDSTLVATIGKSSTFEVATWNIENFPLDGQTTIEKTRQLIREMDIDLIAVQEIGSVSAFLEMLDGLPQWRGIWSSHTYGNGSYQKVGLIYKSTLISVASDYKLLFEDNGFAFPRPPLMTHIIVRDNEGISFDFNLIVLHLKAFSGDEEDARRQQACDLLSGYIEDEIAAGADPDFVVLGDWNDELSDSLVFRGFYERPELFHFLTQNIGNQYSYIDSRYRSLIDHILITSDALGEYGDGKTEVFYVDDQYPAYPAEVSDHRPVISTFRGFELKLE